jgi:hypothetical protein
MGTLYEYVCTFVIYLAEFFLETFRTKVINKIKTHFMLNNFFSRIVTFMRHYGKTL